MGRLSSPLGELGGHYRAVVVGTGYGGAIAASRLSRAGQAVCVLERGKEFRPGEFPDTELEALAEAQVQHPAGHSGDRTGLYDFRVFDDINVFLGCGLGGTSLVNANVSIEPDPRVFEDERWPGAFRADVDQRLADGFAKARQMLRPVTFPGEPLPKTAALKKIAEATGQPFELLPINVNFDIDGPNHVGVDQRPCVLCGDCVSGCNHGAKNTVLMNYLPDAKNHGAKIFTGVEVAWIERKDDRWLIHYRVAEAGREAFDAPTLFVTADVVVLAAGALGSTEILLRSREKGLPLSGQLGQRFTGNGDVLAFAYNGKDEVRGTGFGPRSADRMDPVGPCITSAIDVRETDDLDEGMIVEEGSIPGAVDAVAAGVVGAAANLVGERTDSGLAGGLRGGVREIETVLRGATYGAMRNTLTQLVMTHDDSGGRLTLDRNRLRIEWPGVGDQGIFKKVDERLRRSAEALGATHVPNPTWTPLTKNALVTVHPLGGAVMGEHAESGVVDHRGEVFSGVTGTDTHTGLYVCDGAVVPRSLGVNPLLTISAIAERTCQLMAEDRGWSLDTTIEAPEVPEDSAALPSIQFTERMFGHISLDPDLDFEGAEREGRDKESTLDMIATIIATDVEAFLSDKDGQAEMVGSVLAPSISPDPLTMSEGSFRLFVDDGSEALGKRMEYRAALSAEDGRSFHFEGSKHIQDEPGPNLWKSTSTLYVTLREGGSEGAVLGRGVLHILPADFVKQLGTMKVANAHDARERLDLLCRFGEYFAGSLFEVFGGALRKTNAFLTDGAPRKKRSLRLSPPEIHWAETDDGVQLRLTRYDGGGKGPIILAPGFATPSVAFRMDTLDTTLAEFLFERGYDVWLFDYRGSPDIPASRGQFSLDEIATLDWPAGVAKVRAETGREDVQVLGHCVASVTLFMGFLSGRLEGVRSAICSQFMPHIHQPLEQWLKVSLDLGKVLPSLGITSMTTDFDARSVWDRALDGLLKLYPSRERCSNPVCRRILLMFGDVYLHEQLNRATHMAVHEMFGTANMTTFQHLALVIRRKLALDREGKDVYMPHVDRLKLPITLLQGAQNGIFNPSGSEATYDWLREANGEELYSRRVIEAYGHMDCFIGRDAHRDVFPVILEELERGDEVARG